MRFFSVVLALSLAGCALRQLATKTVSGSEEHATMPAR